MTISGDSIGKESALLLCNHQSLADHLVVQHLARAASNSVENSNNSTPTVNFFSWFLLWRVPTLRILFHVIQGDENWELDPLLAESFFDKVFNSAVPEWIVLFPEVNIWTQHNANLQKHQSEKFYLPLMNSVLYPRFSSFSNVMLALNAKNAFKSYTLYDVTVFYRNHTGEDLPFRPTTLLDVFSNSEPINIEVYVKKRHTSRVPLKRRKLERWLEHLWVDKDKHLTNMGSARASDKVVIREHSLLDFPLSVPVLYLLSALSFHPQIISTTPGKLGIANSGRVLATLVEETIAI